MTEKESYTLFVWGRLKPDDQDLVRCQVGVNVPKESRGRHYQGTMYGFVAVLGGELDRREENLGKRNEKGSWVTFLGEAGSFASGYFVVVHRNLHCRTLVTKRDKRREQRESKKAGSKVEATARPKATQIFYLWLGASDKGLCPMETGPLH